MKINASKKLPANASTIDHVLLLDDDLTAHYSKEHLEKKKLQCPNNNLIKDIYIYIDLILVMMMIRLIILLIVFIRSKYDFGL
jgi:hypothetical protein